MILTNNKIIALTLLFSLSLNVSSVSVEFSYSGQSSNAFDDSASSPVYTFRDKCIKDLDEMLYDFNKGILHAFLHGLLRLNNIALDEAPNHYGITYYYELFVYSNIIITDFASGEQYFGNYNNNITQMLFNAGLWNETPENTYRNIYFNYSSLHFIAKPNAVSIYAGSLARKITSISPIIGHVLYNPREYCDRNLPIAPVIIPQILY